MIEEKEQKELSVEQAFNMIAEISTQYKGTLQDHQAIQNALKVLNEVINKHKIEQEVKK